MSRAQEERTKFYERHKDAHYLVVHAKTGVPLGAIYYALDWQIQPEVVDADLRRFFMLVREVEFRQQQQENG